MSSLWIPERAQQDARLREIREKTPEQYARIALLENRLAELEYEVSSSWERVSGRQQSEQFTKQTINDISDIARVLALKNPLVRRAITVKSGYTFGQGVAISATHPRINEVVQRFLDDERNQAELTSHQAMLLADRDLQCDGNRFFVLFTNQVTGRVRVRSIPLPEIAEIITNPEDQKEAWYYIRVFTDAASQQSQVVAYPDYQYTPKQRPSVISSLHYRDVSVRWDAPIYHVKTGGFSDWLFGVSDILAAQDWAKAYNRFLEDVATYMATLSSFAAKVTTSGGRTGITKAQERFSSTVGSTGYETNPPPVAGSAFVRSYTSTGHPSADWEPVKVSGMSLSPEDGRRFLLMVCAALDMQETFFGDVSVGTLATAKSLDRPTELIMQNRQKLWQSVFTNILRYVIQQAVVAQSGSLADIAIPQVEMDSGEKVVFLRWEKDPETGSPYDPSVFISFPPVVDIDTQDRIDAIVKASTLGGKASAGQVIDMRTTTRLILETLGVERVDETLQRLYPEGEDIEVPDTIGSIGEMLSLHSQGIIDTGSVQRLLGIKDVAALQKRIEEEQRKTQTRDKDTLAQAMMRARRDFDRPDVSSIPDKDEDEEEERGE